MKTFFNVLYRRILYKIPLKFLLILLAVCAIFIACFSSADFVPDFVLSGPLTNYTTQFQGSTSKNYVSLFGTNSSIDYSNFTVCLPDSYAGTDFGGVSLYNCTVSLSATSDDPSTNSNCLKVIDLTLIGGTSERVALVNSVSNCYNFSSSNRYFYLYYATKKSGAIHIPYLVFNRNLLKTYFNSGYIEESSIDSQYCVSNNLCPSNVLMTENQCKSIYGLIDSNSCPEVPDCPDNPNIGTSNLYINDIFHPGAFNIIMNIPEEIDWDYAYTNSGYNFNLDIEGYNVDYEKMQGVIDTQSYIPTEEDFQNIIAILTPYTKIIVFFVFLFIVWAWIKKPFKSKKL